jgi:hypothetical protein
VLLAASEQELLDMVPPLVSDVNVTCPVGAVGLDVASVTVAVQEVAWPMTTACGEQVRTVLVVRTVRVSAAWPLLGAWLPSPAYAAVMVWVLPEPV